MSNWHVWHRAFELLTLRCDGDGVEIQAATEHGLDISFANYELFWRRHVVPATNRPANIDLRKEAAREFVLVAILSHSILSNLLEAANALKLVRAGDLSGAQFSNCTLAIQQGGNAVQKFKEFKDAIEKTLAPQLGLTIEIWSQADWQATWKPSRERIIWHRNYLVHTGQIPVLLDHRPDGEPLPIAIRPDEVTRGQTLTWQEQEELYRTNPEKWAPLATVCDELFAATVSWLNDAYCEVLCALDPLVTSEDYQRLWGWDTTTWGRHPLKYKGVSSAYGFMRIPIQ